MDIQTQYATTLLLTASGALLGAVYDIYRTSLSEWRFLRRFGPLFDFLFWVFALIWVFTMLLPLNHGDVRIVVFVLLLIGFAVYRMTLHSLVVASTRFLVRCIIWVLRVVWRTVYVTVIVPLLWMWRSVRLLLRFIDRLLFRVEPVIVWPVVRSGKGAYAVGRFSVNTSKKYVRPIVNSGKEQWSHLANTYRKVIGRWWKSEDDSDDGET